MLLCLSRGSDDISVAAVLGLRRGCSGRVIAGLGTRQGWAAPGGAQALIRSRPAGQVRPGTADESFAGQQVRGSRISGQAVPELSALAGRAEVAVDLAGDVTLQAADNLRLGFPFGRAALGVGAGGRVRAQPGEHDPTQGMIGLAVPAGAVPVAGDFPR